MLTRKPNRKPRKRPAKIKAKKQEPIRIGDKIVKASRQCVLTIYDVDTLTEATIK
jgi:hypothetical protein